MVNMASLEAVPNINGTNGVIGELMSELSEFRDAHSNRGYTQFSKEAKGFLRTFRNRLTYNVSSMPDCVYTAARDVVDRIGGRFELEGDTNMDLDWVRERLGKFRKYTGTGSYRYDPNFRSLPTKPRAKSGLLRKAFTAGLTMVMAGAVAGYFLIQRVNQDASPVAYNRQAVTQMPYSNRANHTLAAAQSAPPNLTPSDPVPDAQSTVPKAVATPTVPADASPLQAAPAAQSAPLKLAITQPAPTAPEPVSDVQRKEVTSEITAQARQLTGYKITKERFGDSARRGGLWGIADHAGIDPAAFINFVGRSYGFGADRDTLRSANGRIEQGADGLGPDIWSWDEVGNEIVLPLGDVQYLNPDIARLDPVYKTDLPKAKNEPEPVPEKLQPNPESLGGPPGGDGGQEIKKSTSNDTGAGKVLEFKPPAERAAASLSPLYKTRIIGSFVDYYMKTGDLDKAADYTLFGEPDLDKGDFYSIVGDAKRRIRNITETTQAYLSDGRFSRQEKETIRLSQMRKIEQELGRKFSDASQLQSVVEEILYADETAYSGPAAKAA